MSVDEQAKDKSPVSLLQQVRPIAKIVFGVMALTPILSII